jgi:excisionase family DNA binding protein
LISQRRIPFVKLGRHVRLERSSLDQFIDAGRVPSR